MIWISEELGMFSLFIHSEPNFVWFNRFLELLTKSDDDLQPLNRLSVGEASVDQIEMILNKKRSHEEMSKQCANICGEMQEELSICIAKYDKAH